MAAGPQVELTIAATHDTALSASNGPTEILADAVARLEGGNFSVHVTGTSIRLMGPAMGVTDTPTPGA